MAESRIFHQYLPSIYSFFMVNPAPRTRYLDVVVGAVVAHGHVEQLHLLLRVAAAPF